MFIYVYTCTYIKLLRLFRMPTIEITKIIKPKLFPHPTLKGSLHLLEEDFSLSTEVMF